MRQGTLSRNPERHGKSVPFFLWPKCGTVRKGQNLTEMVKHQNSESGALKLKPAAQYLGGLSVPTMHRLIKRGLLRPNKSTRHLLFTISELDRFLKDGMT